MYFPKSQITVDLYTNGNEFTDNNTKQPYQGFYFKTSAGQFYTGKSPQNPPNVQLSRIKKNTSNSVVTSAEAINPTRETSIDYFPIRQDPKTIPQNSEIINTTQAYPYPPVANAPISSVTFPTENDYTIGEFQRYFLKKRNEIQYLEVNVSTYLNYTNQSPGVQWQLYLPISIPWDLVGDIKSVYATNRNIVLLKEANLRIVGFANSFKNQFTKFYRLAPGQEAKVNTDNSLEVGTSRRKNIQYYENHLKKDDKRFGY